MAKVEIYEPEYPPRRVWGLKVSCVKSDDGWQEKERGFMCDPDDFETARKTAHRELDRVFDSLINSLEEGKGQ